MEAGNSNLLDKLFILPKSDASVVLCNGSTEVGTVAATSSGDVSAVGAGCASGDCLVDGTVTSGTTMFVWEGSTANANQYTWSVSNADIGSAITYTWPDTTGEVGIFPAGCTGTADYADGAGNCDTINGVEDLETATDDAVLVGNNTTFDHKVLSDADAPSTTAAGATVHYDTATNAFSASTIPTIKTWAPMGYLINQTDAGGVQAIDECLCQMITLTQPMAQVDEIYVRWGVGTAGTGDDTFEFALYEEDGNPSYLECDILDAGESGTTGAGDACKTATQTSNTEVLQPGNYWACIAADAADTLLTGVFQSAAANAQVPTCQFTQACASGEAPDTLTSPSCSWQTTQLFGLMLFDQ